MNLCWAGSQAATKARRVALLPLCKACHNGKSTALRLFLHAHDPGLHPAVYVAASGLSPRSFYGRVLAHFGVQPPASAGRAREQFQTLLLELSTASGKRPLLLIDEGHELPQEMVQELRYLQNVQDCDAAWGRALSEAPFRTHSLTPMA